MEGCWHSSRTEHGDCAVSPPGGAQLAFIETAPNCSVFACCDAFDNAWRHNHYREAQYEGRGDILIQGERMYARSCRMFMKCFLPPSMRGARQRGQQRPQS